MNIILDMDETLIHSVFIKNRKYAEPIARPHLKEFLEFRKTLKRIYILNLP
jgi:hypothetical protein